MRLILTVGGLSTGFASLTHKAGRFLQGNVCFEDSVERESFRNVFTNPTSPSGQSVHCHKMKVYRDQRIELVEEPGLPKEVGLSLTGRDLTMVRDNVFTVKVRVKKRGRKGHPCCPPNTIPATIELEGTVEESLQGDNVDMYMKLFGDVARGWGVRVPSPTTVPVNEYDIGEVCFAEEIPQVDSKPGQCHKMHLKPDYRINLLDGGLKGLSLSPKGLIMTDENVFHGKVRVKDKRLRGTRSIRATIKLDGSIRELSEGDTQKVYSMIFGHLVKNWRRSNGHEAREIEEHSDEEDDPIEETKILLTQSNIDRLNIEGEAGPRGLTIKANNQLEIEGIDDPTASISLKPKTFAKTGSNKWTGKVMLKPLRGTGSIVRRGLMTVTLEIQDDVADTLFEPKVDASEIQLDPDDATRLKLSEYVGTPIKASILHDGRLDPVNGRLSTDDGTEVTMSIKPQTIEGRGRRVQAKVAVKSVRSNGSREKSLGTAKMTLSLTKRDYEMMNRIRSREEVERSEEEFVE
ncbi:hypothetical protein Pmar_PMAR021170 [Perkinsus marinus ATCC 50983]|uniref:Uncharacterized protein n=1 Tax=Perkinsus marinus (strain ATCC 50983 / TXsc) TaxID=423536 RepID=C5KM56_PERM5|nr:hypothetical protein Pmar_PMAR021170 [Perkinsus marinus ATCC 50983]EER14417.1 hypothetical protein Pmar_PMAR021170 [Perkinsus marinus ATCC 50983]|eukprot:XP_002782622.1 hypothetical protein Pmar_PMAR021170 [Perkinsus marinus ATCC 50983]